MHRWQKRFHFVQESVVRNAELGAGEQGSDSLPSSLISLLCCSKHHTEEQQRGRQDSTIIQTAQTGFKTRIQGFRIALRDFTLAEDDVVTNRLLIICTNPFPLSHCCEHPSLLCFWGRALPSQISAHSSHLLSLKNH